MKGFLSEREREELRIAHRHESQLRYGDRIKAVLLLDAGWSVSKISEALLLDGNTIRRYRDLYQAEGIDGLCNDNYHGRVCALTQRDQKELCKALRTKIYLSTVEIVCYVEGRFKVTYSLSGMTYLLHRLGFSYKKPSVVPGKADSLRQEKFLRAYRRLKRVKNAGDKVYFVDGVHPQHNSLPSYGWLPKGEETKLKSNTGRQRANISGALDAETHEVLVQEHKTLNAETTIEFFRMIERKNQKAKNIYLILDNAGYYKGDKIRDFLKDSSIKLLYLPPYAPNLNLIERLWKFFKKQVLYNQYYETFAEFRSACLDFFSRKNIRRYQKQLATLLTDNFEIIYV
jgi:transposase